jgi:hypothetical protein
VESEKVADPFLPEGPATFSAFLVPASASDKLSQRAILEARPAEEDPRIARR